MIRISIVVPHHNETPKQIAPLLQSLNNQIGIDFNEIEVLFVHDVLDRESPLASYDFSAYPNLVGHIRHEKSVMANNPGISRQTGVDLARGDYVFFCDADDSLYTLGVLRELTENIQNSNADMYRFKFLEEVGSPDTSARVYLMKDFNYTWVFAKAYKVEFLRKNGLRFNPQLRWHEDSYFNFICRYAGAKVVDVNSCPAYLWRFNASSITRANHHDYIFNSSDEFITAIARGIDFVTNTLKKDCMADILGLVAKSYWELVDPKYANKQNYSNVEQTYANFIHDYIPQLFEDEYEEKIEVSLSIALSQTASSALIIPKISFRQYMKTIKEKYFEK